MDKKVIITIGWCQCYIVTLGVKGDSGEPGPRGLRGAVGKLHIMMLLTSIHNFYIMKIASLWIQPYDVNNYYYLMSESKQGLWHLATKYAYLENCYFLYVPVLL